MSMTSKVDPILQNEILGLLTTGVLYSNRALWVRVGIYSLRTIQEATQKMTREGLLVKSRTYGFTFYGLAPQTTTVSYNGIALTNVATA